MCCIICVLYLFGEFVTLYCTIFFFGFKFIYNTKFRVPHSLFSPSGEHIWNIWIWIHTFNQTSHLFSMRSFTILDIAISIAIPIRTLSKVRRISLVKLILLLVVIHYTIISTLSVYNMYKYIVVVESLSPFLC